MDPAEDLLEWMEVNLRRFGDIFRASVYGSSVYVINSPEYADHVLLRHWRNYLRKGPAVKRIAMSLGNGLISGNGEFWIRHRRMIQPAFTREAVRALTETFKGPNRALRQKWLAAADSAASVNVTRDVSATVLEVTLRSIFGDDYEQIAPHFELIAESGRDLTFVQSCNTLIHLIVRIIAQRRAADKVHDDVLGIVMRSRDRDSGLPMPDSELSREVLTLVIAGHETTASVLNWMWYLLSKHEAIDARVAGEIHEQMSAEEPSFEDGQRLKYARQVVEEVLRCYPPLWLITRKAMERDQLGEFLVPAGTEIYLSPYLIQREPRLWEEPDSFDPDRFDNGIARDATGLAMCPFGAGPRNCIGEFFARTEILIHLMSIASALRLRGDSRERGEHVAGVNLLSRNDFIMKPERRHREQPLRNLTAAAGLEARAVLECP